MTSDVTRVFRSVNHQRVAHVTNFLHMHLKIVTLNWNRGILNKLKSRGLIYSGFHLNVRISRKLSKQSVLWRGLRKGRGGGGRREKYLLHNKVLFLTRRKPAANCCILISKVNSLLAHTLLRSVYSFWKAYQSVSRSLSLCPDRGKNDQHK